MRGGKTEREPYIDRQLVGILHDIVDIGGYKESGVHAKPRRYQSAETLVAYLEHEYP